MQAVWRLATHRTRWCGAFAALVLMMAALITPWGLATSHGSAALSAKVHETDRGDVENHGHSHEDEETDAGAAHAHHGSDHSHDTAHALPLALAAFSQVVPGWADGPESTTPSPSLAGLDRPPKG